MTENKLDRANFRCPFKEYNVGVVTLLGEVEGVVHGCNATGAPMAQEGESNKGTRRLLCGANSGEDMNKCYLDVTKEERIYRV